jgi:hypothetical protein
MAALIAILLIVSAEAVLALPVQGNLVITSGTVLMGRGPFGPYLDGSVAGPGFSIFLFACAEQSCVRTVPGLTSTTPSVPIPPATVFAPLSFAANAGTSPAGGGVFDFVSATILGVNYQQSSAGSVSDNSFRVISPLLFSVNMETPALPPPGASRSINLVSPFHFCSEWIITDNALAGHNLDPLLDVHLTGEGTATAALFGPSCFPEPCGWQFPSMTFDFGMTPTPEPATLLLWGTSAAGLGLIRWVRRRQREHPQTTGRGAAE